MLDSRAVVNGEVVGINLVVPHSLVSLFTLFPQAHKLLRENSLSLKQELRELQMKVEVGMGKGREGKGREGRRD